MELAFTCLPDTAGRREVTIRLSMRNLLGWSDHLSLPWLGAHGDLDRLLVAGQVCLWRHEEDAMRWIFAACVLILASGVVNDVDAQDITQHLQSWSTQINKANHRFEVLKEFSDRAVPGRP
jgi:hypothetical protein